MVLYSGCRFTVTIPAKQKNRYGCRAVLFEDFKYDNLMSHI